MYWAAAGTPTSYLQSLEIRDGLSEQQQDCFFSWPCQNAFGRKYIFNLWNCDCCDMKTSNLYLKTEPFFVQPYRDTITGTRKENIQVKDVLAISIFKLLPVFERHVSVSAWRSGWDVTAIEFLKRLWSYHVVKQVTWFSAYLIKAGIACWKQQYSVSVLPFLWSLGCIFTDFKWNTKLFPWCVGSYFALSLVENLLQ